MVEYFSAVHLAAGNTNKEGVMLMIKPTLTVIQTVTARMATQTTVVYMEYKALAHEVKRLLNLWKEHFDNKDLEVYFSSLLEKLGHTVTMAESRNVLRFSYLLVYLPLRAVGECDPEVIVRQEAAKVVNALREVTEEMLKALEKPAPSGLTRKLPSYIRVVKQ